MAGLNKITEAVTETYTDAQRLALGMSYIPRLSQAHP